MKVKKIDIKKILGREYPIFFWILASHTDTLSDGVLRFLNFLMD